MSTALRRYYGGHNLVTMRDVQANASRHYHFDHQGTTQCLTDNTATLTDRFSSDAWGLRVKRTGVTVNPMWYVGKLGYHDHMTVTMLYVRRRYYRVPEGRWLSVDPLTRGPAGTASTTRWWMSVRHSASGGAPVSARWFSSPQTSPQLGFASVGPLSVELGRLAEQSAARLRRPEDVVSVGWAPFGYAENSPGLSVDPTGLAPKPRPGLPTCNGPIPWPPMRPGAERNCYADACGDWSKERDKYLYLEDHYCATGGIPIQVFNCSMVNRGLPPVTPNDPSCPLCFRTGGDPPSGWTSWMSDCCVECTMRVCCWITTPWEGMNDSTRDRRLRECYDRFHSR